jgi:hypothetical protein
MPDRENAPTRTEKAPKPRQERLAEALRANLARRKAQAKARGTAGGKDRS